MPRKTETKTTAAAAAPRKSARLVEQKKQRAGGNDSKKKKTVHAPAKGVRQSERIKERTAGVGFGIGLLAGGVGGWAVGRAMSASDIRRVRALERRNRELEDELARRR